MNRFPNDTQEPPEEGVHLYTAQCSICGLLHDTSPDQSPHRNLTRSS
jgi:hypothetical protein